MRSVRIAHALPRPIGAPPDWDSEKHGHCGGLFIRPEQIDGIPYMRSAWEVEPTEALTFLAGAKFELGISGTRHPVVQLRAGDLPESFDPVVMARQFAHPTGAAMVRVEMMFPHEGGRRGWIEVEITGTLAGAIAEGIVKIEELARNHGWTA